MTDFGWMRLAYLLAVLSVLAALAQLGSPSAEPRPLASEPPEKRPAPGVSAPTRGPHEHESDTQRSDTRRAEDAARERPAAPPFARHLKRSIAVPPNASPGGGRAVFYRPPPRPTAASPGSGERPGTGPDCGDLGRFPSVNRLVFPLPMQHANSFGDTWGAPRPQGGHEGTDLMVPTGTPEYAVTDGTIVPVIGSNGNGWNSLGGYAVMLRAAYSAGPVREGDLFYYAHLNRKSALPLGATVRAGQLVGYAGDTGQGPEVTRGLFPPHLHFGWYDATGTRSYLPSGAMNPYPLLEWLRAGGGVLVGGMDASYCEVPRGGAPTPSTGGDRWPAARDPGARPDLDTGTRTPAPRPPAAKAHPPGRRAAQPERAAPARVTPDRRPIPSEPPPSGPENTGKRGEPAPPAGPPPRGAPPEAGQPATGQSPKEAVGSPRESADASGASPENGPPREGSDPPDTEPEPREGTGKSEDPVRDPDEANRGREEPAQPEAGEREPEEEEPEVDMARPDEETTPDEDESASETGADEDPEAAPSEAGGSVDDEEPPQEATTETTTAE